MKNRVRTYSKKKIHKHLERVEFFQVRPKFIFLYFFMNKKINWNVIFENGRALSSQIEKKENMENVGIKTKLKAKNTNYSKPSHIMHKY